jgi:hypothetical protein
MAVRSLQAIHSCQQALVHHMLDRDGECPEDLRVLVQQRYLSTAPVDAWGRPLRHTCTTDEPRVWSVGPDGREGTEHDLQIE